MYKPGLSRAVPMGVIGFLVGALVVFGIRALQSLTPIWDPGVGLVFGTFFSAGFFIWGMGGFDPRMSVHGDGEHGHEDADAHAEEVAEPMTILGASIWQVMFYTLLMLLALGAFAWLGPRLITTSSPDASVGDIGMVTMELFGSEVVVSYLIIFTAFMLFLFLSLAVTAGGIGFLLNFLNQGVVESRAAAAGGGTAALPPPVRTTTPRSRPFNIALFLVKFAVIFTILYLLFFYVLIGLIIPQPVELLTALSVVNALAITLIILIPRQLVQLLARFAGWLGGVLRSRNKPYEGVRKNDRSNRE